MPWVKKWFKRTQKVWVLVDDSGQPVVEGGRVSLRYQNNDEARVYHGYPGNVGEDVGEGDAPSGGASSAAARAAEAARAARTARASAPPPQRAPVTGATSPNTNSQTSILGGMSSRVGMGPGAGELKESDEVPDSLIDVPWPAEGVVEVYTDGACSGNPGPCSLGALMRSDGGYREWRQYLGKGTNNIGELMAIKVGLEQVMAAGKADAIVRVHTDSNYSIGVLTKNWKAKANQELIASIKALMAHFPRLTLVKVRGHSGQPLNERADWLAVRAISDR